MRVLFVTFLFAANAIAEAWIHVPTTNEGSRSKLMASRGRAKWDRKKKWLAKRGFSEDDNDLTEKDDSVTIIGSGRIGGLLAEGDESVIVGRNDAINKEGSGPILVATRNDALDGIVEACPENRRKDLVFMQNGYLDDFLKAKCLLDNTQVLLFLSVAKKGTDAIDGITKMNPEGLTAVTGEHAQAFASRLASLNLKCNVISNEEYRPAMFEKLIWISTYMLVGTAKECSSVGEAGDKYKELVEEVITELITAVSAKEGITFSDGAIERLASYTEVVKDFPCAVKEFEWRNEYFFKLGDENCPTHNGLLRECSEKGFISFELP